MSQDPSRRLEPCPFCGREAADTGTVRYSRSHVKEQGWDQSEFYFCSCPYCGVNNKGIVGWPSVEDARKHWNTRTPPPGAGGEAAQSLPPDNDPGVEELAEVIRMYWSGQTNAADCARMLLVAGWRRG